MLLTDPHLFTALLLFTFLTCLSMLDISHWTSLTESHVAEYGSRHLKYQIWDTKARRGSGVPEQPNSLGYVARHCFVVLFFMGGRREI